MLTIFTFLIILSILIFVHESGHFLAARLTGIKVEEFAFGLPFTKALFSKKIKKVKISAYPILFGGFVKLLGEEEKELKSKKIPPNAFCAKSSSVRAFVTIAGVFMNFLLTILIITFILVKGVFIPTNKVYLEKIFPNTPASKAGLLKNDQILEINNQKITNPQQLITYTKKNLGQKITLQVLRDNKKLTFKITPRKKYPSNQGPMGIAISNLEEKKYPLFKAPYYALKETVNLSLIIFKAIYLMVKEIILKGAFPKDVAGPIGVAQLTGQAVQFGYMAVFWLTAFLSLNLAIFNILPFPALDGGRLLFIFAEVVFGKKIAPKVEQIVNTAGMAILFAFVILVTINDLNRIFNFQKLLAPFF